jgi:hypothetical protein
MLVRAGRRDVPVTVCGDAEQLTVAVCVVLGRAEGEKPSARDRDSSEVLAERSTGLRVDPLVVLLPDQVA